MPYQLKVNRLGTIQSYYYRKLSNARAGLKTKVIDVAKGYIALLPSPTHSVEKATPRSIKTINVVHHSYLESFGADYYALIDKSKEEPYLYISGVIERIGPEETEDEE